MRIRFLRSDRIYKRLNCVEGCAVYEDVYEEDKLSKSDREILLTRR